MNPKLPSFAVLVLITASSALHAAPAYNEDDAIALGKKGECFKCHAVEKRKKAPSYREIAKKYANKPNAINDLYLHITGTPTVKLDEGEEPHKGPPTKDRKELENLIFWILSRNAEPA